MKIELNLPDRIELDCSLEDFKMYIAVSLYEKGILSTGVASELIGMGRVEFIHKMDKYGKSIYYRTEEELRKDMENAEKIFA